MISEITRESKILDSMVNTQVLQLRRPHQNLQRIGRNLLFLTAASNNENIELAAIQRFAWNYYSMTHLERGTMGYSYRGREDCRNNQKLDN